MSVGMCDAWSWMLEETDLQESQEEWTFRIQKDPL